MGGLKLRLGPKIFLYLVALVAFSQAGVLLVFYLNRWDNAEDTQWRVDFIESWAAKFVQLGPEKASLFVELFNPQGGMVWFENEAGDPVMGRPHPLMTAQARPKLTGRRQTHGDIEIWETDLPVERPILLAKPINWPNHKYILYYSSGFYKRLPVANSFIQGVLALVALTLVMSVWMARRVSHPLRILRAEVLNIAEGGCLEKPVSIQGDPEVADVARSINHLSAKLAKYINETRDLMANVSHELKSPLGRLSLALEMVTDEIDRLAQDPLAIQPKSWDKTRELLKSVTEERIRMAKIVGGVLLSSKLNLGQANFTMNYINLSKLCLSSIERNAYFSESKTINIINKIDNNIYILGDKTLLDLAIDNLIINAIKYTKSNIYVILIKNDKNIILKIDNEHDLIPETKFPKFFRAFYQECPGLGDGVGLGLTIAKRILELHKANIELKNSSQEGRAVVRAEIAWPEVEWA
ncbi:MAG: HAMP domain-containing histidine kinase [Deltaproteobacteria bacterium]|jgi:signal transduction histidine kinase|nr:HAMP domain-containing histidine kinase [Deltaproteobacteria bacterium]